MRAVRYRTDSGGGVRLEEIPKPSPGHLEVLLRVRAAGVCGTDVGIAYGANSRLVTPPAVTLGHEIAGEVVELGEGVRGVGLGDRAVVAPVVVCGECRYCARGDVQLCSRSVVFGLGRDGGFAEFVTVPSANLVVIPDELPWEQAAVLTDAAATPYHALIERGGLRIGESVLITGVGGLGQHAVQIARLAGAAPIIAVDTRADSLERAVECGADVTLDAGSEDVVKRVRALTGGGVDLATDFTGDPDAIRVAFDALSRGGRLQVVGLGSSEVTLPASNRFAMREISLCGSGGYGRGVIERLVSLVMAGRLRLDESVSHRLSLDEVDVALQMLADRRPGIRRIVITLGADT